ncbi:DUF2846 domain-containing protein [Halomonas sp. McH1-25]|uniref:DUF2846 domain-containing protein n=1 Tax=unclassified Halomonas TaxID=2609666 RepID=UPI001EF60142|nr:MULTISPECIES: DUF2846 domain-containing protein [unclassified Halomonas]MCG7600778.1 DUF2846 domain-containing protein [Halomonas sp. McH1-25]MCP1342743.1 DUF2846 domain-containing protein [Halomonas sp. FL8]MCP1361048.1 DUF2846 domain-containing protein [Halomonas sp. BBD45]MCP1367924.1 DUF2846 domain-containing protein [Halomonas sp. BBD48]
MFRNVIAGVMLLLTLGVSGCASVPMGPSEEDLALKQFPAPPENMAGLYVYRDSFMGQALKKTVALDGKTLGETANGIYFYKVISPGKHTLATESEFSDNLLSFEADADKNYFVEQYMKMGVFVGGAGLKMIDETTGMSAVRECCRLAASQ